MSFPEASVPTEAQQILAKLDKADETQRALIDAVNSLGKNIQWIIDNVQTIFQMFGDPNLMSMVNGAMPKMMEQMGVRE